jgi:hypothetical protein
MPKQCKLYQFTGTHDRLVTGEFYSINMLAIILDISDATLWRRLQYKDVLTDHEVRKAVARKATEGHTFDRLETDSDRLSSKWLRLAL